jgi:hypothetical protein
VSEGFGKENAMKILSYAGLAVVIMIAIAGAATVQDRYAAPVANGTEVYADNPKPLDAQPAFTVGTGDRLLILDRRDNKYKVSDLKGDVGWVNADLVKSLGSNESLVFGDADVRAYLDNPEPVYIMDADNNVDKSILLNRSFAGELAENTDRMTFERMAGENLPK